MVNSLQREKPSLTTYLAIKMPPLGQENRCLAVQSSDEGRADKRKPPEQRDDTFAGGPVSSG